MSNRSIFSLFYILVLFVGLSCVCTAQEPWSFIITGDSRGYDDGVNTVILAELADEIVDANVDFLIFAGDLVTGSRDPQIQINNWLTVMQPVYQAGIGVYAIRGNHEDGYFFPDISIWHDAFSGAYAMPQNGPEGEVNLTWSFEHKNAFVVGLDQYVNTLEVNQPWLDARLAQNTNPHVFLMGHVAAFEVRHRSWPLGCLDFFPDKRDVFWKSIKDAGARTYFGSHDHLYNHARIDDGDGNANNDLHQYVIGTAGAPPYSWTGDYDGNNSSMTPILLHRAQAYGYIIVRIDALDVTLTWMERNTPDSSAAGLYQSREVWSYSAVPFKLLSPNGEEQIAAGGSYTIAWRMYEGAAVENVRLEYFDGAAWNAINQDPLAAAAGSYLWDPVDPADSTECLIRISDWDDPAQTDASDDFFTIFTCQVSLPGDINRDCYVNMADLIIMAANWLRCANPYDPACTP